MDGNKAIAYLRISTGHQDTEKDKVEVLKLAHTKGLLVDFIEEIVSGKVSWKERAIYGIVKDMKSGSRLIVPELSRLGRSMLEIMEILSVCTEKKIEVYSVRDGWELNSSMQSKVMATVFAMASEIEHQLISARTKEALRAKKMQGVRIGRPKGPGKSKLDQHRPEIEALLKNGSRKTFVARRYGTSTANLDHWLKMKKIDVTPII